MESKLKQFISEENTQNNLTDGVITRGCEASGVYLALQERHHHNLDLTHENWGEATEEQMGCCSIIITGDKGAGKTTFLSGLSSGNSKILQALRYDNASFYNIWYGSNECEIDLLKASLKDRDLHFYQTELAHASMTIPFSEFALFMEDNEYTEPSQPIPILPHPQPTHVLLRILEIGGDALNLLSSSKVICDEKQQIYNSIKTLLSEHLSCQPSICYFVSDDVSAETRFEKIQTLKKTSNTTSISLFTRSDEDQWSGLVEEFRNCGFESIKIFNFDHLNISNPDNVIMNNVGILRTMRRILNSNEMLVGGNMLVKVAAPQLLAIIFDRHDGSILTSSSYSDLLHEYHEDIEHSEVYSRGVLPRVVLPPSFFAFAEDQLVDLLVSKYKVLLPLSVCYTITKGSDVLWVHSASEDEKSYHIPQSKTLLSIINHQLALFLPTSLDEPFVGVSVVKELVCEAVVDGTLFFDVFVAALMADVSEIQDADGNTIRFSVGKLSSSVSNKSG